MKIANSQMYPSDAPAEYLERIAKKQATDLLDGVIGQIEKDKWYAIRWSDIDLKRRTVSISKAIVLGEESKPFEKALLFHC